MKWLRRYFWRLTLLLTAGSMLLAVIVWLGLPKVSIYPEAFQFSPVLRDRTGTLLHLALTPDAKYRIYSPLEDISPDLKDATLLLEDRHFYQHPGVNPLSMLRAVWGVMTGTTRGGGSTITMQHARLRFGLQTRSFMGKAAQMFRAIQLERHYNKDQILEAYLNLAPYGGNVEGVGAASMLWCGKPANELNLREAVALAVLPQSPTRRRPKADSDNSALAAAQFRLIQRIQEQRGLRADPLDAQYTLKPNAKVPRQAPHLARRLFLQHTTSPESNQAVDILSTIDAEEQASLEKALSDYVDLRGEMGIRNACALLVHAPSREVRAYVGSASFLDADILGQVDGVPARRSPGSALKPFVYALAMQEGLIQPRTLLRDGKMAFGGYDPENFDRQFAGPISAENALYHSRNIPAVSLAQRLKGDGLYGFLKNAGVALPRPSSFYGLSLPLGGGEVSMEELGELYSMLADDGCVKKLMYLQGETTHRGETLLTPEACFLAREMLRPREGEPVFDDGAVSWKTGTSHGFRDAWAAGIRGEYVLIVWIGNFNGKSNPAFIARESAAPLLFEAFRKLHLPVLNPPTPTGVDEVTLCAVSGQLPSPCCQHRRKGWFIPGVSPIAPCSIHREIFIDDATGLRVAADDGRPGLRHEVFEFWPPDMLELYRQAGLPRKEPPPLEPNARSLTTASGLDSPLITSPRTALVYTLRTRDPSKQRIPLLADVAAGVRKVYWFAGKEFLGQTGPVDPVMWQASPGKWRLQVLDDHGRSASCEVVIQVVD